MLTKNTLKVGLLPLLLVFLSINLFAQSTGVSSAETDSLMFFTNSSKNMVITPNGKVRIGDILSTSPSAILQLNSTSGGVLIPRMTTIQRDALTTPTEGLLIYNIDNKQFEVYDGTSTWDVIFASNNLSGSSELSDSDNDTKIEVEQSADEDYIRFTVSTTEAMTIDPYGFVGINNPAPGAALDLSGDYYQYSSWSGSTSPVYGHDVITELNSGAQSDEIVGIISDLLITATASTSGDLSTSSQASASKSVAVIGTSGSTNEVVGSINAVIAEGSIGANTTSYGAFNIVGHEGTGGTIGTAIGTASLVENSGNGNITTAEGVYVGVNNTGGGSINSAMGIYIDDISSGTTSNHALMTNSGDVLINANNHNASAFQVKSANEDFLLYTDPLNDRVGIGTSSPSSILHVESSDTEVRLSTADNANHSELRFLRAATGVGAVADGDDFGTIRFYGFDGGSYQEGAAIKSEVYGTPGVGDMPGKLRFMTSDAGTASPTDKMVIDYQGRVGIGESFPFDMVEVKSDDDVNMLLKTRSATNESSLKFYRAGAGETIVADGDLAGDLKFYGYDGADYQKMAVIEGQIDGIPAAGDMPGKIEMYTTPAGTITPIKRIAIREYGYVGIGMDTPGEMLTVEGALQLVEQAAPSNTAGYGKFYASSGDNKPHFMASDGTDYDLSGGAAGWETTGNSGTVDGTNFIGNTDNIPLTIRVNNVKSGRIESDAMASGNYSNTMLGYGAGFSNTTGSQNTLVGVNAGKTHTTAQNITAIGFNALRDNTASENVAVGVAALQGNSSGARNTGIGFQSLSTNTTSSDNTALGHQALANSSGTSNTALGSRAGISNSTGNYNTFIGSQAGYSNTTGIENIAVGYQTLYNNIGGGNNIAIGNASMANNTSGGNNTVLGYAAMQNSTTASNNVALGYMALRNTSGGENIAIGKYAGDGNTTGYNNIYIGYNTDAADGTIINAVGLGAGINLSQSNTVILGNGSDVGIGTVAPKSKLDVVGNAETIRNASYSSAAAIDGANINMLRARGTESSPVIVNATDNVGSLAGFAYDGSTFGAVAKIHYEIDGTPGAGDTPGRIQFHTTPDGTSTTVERMRIDNAGNVGIGTTTPQAKLHLSGGNIRVSNYGSVSALSLTRANGSEGSEAPLSTAHNIGAIQFSSWNSGSAAHEISAKIVAEASQNHGAGSIPGDLKFQTTPIGSTTPADRMIINSEGNVGIGTTTPDYVLDVLGDARVGFNGNSDTIQLVPTDFLSIAGVSGGQERFTDDLSGSFGVSPNGGNADFFAAVKIPVGYKVMETIIYTNPTGSGPYTVQVYSVNVEDGVYSQISTAGSQTDSPVVLDAPMTYTHNKYLGIEVLGPLASGGDLITGGYVIIEPK